MQQRHLPFQVFQRSRISGRCRRAHGLDLLCGLRGFDFIGLHLALEGLQLFGQQFVLLRQRFNAFEQVSLCGHRRRWQQHARNDSSQQFLFKPLVHLELL